MGKLVALTAIAVLAVPVAATAPAEAHHNPRHTIALLRQQVTNLQRQVRTLRAQNARHVSMLRSLGVNPARPNPPSGVGTRGNPVPLGRPVDIEGWRFVVHEFVPDAWPEIQAYNMFNDPPKHGFRYAIARLSATRISREPGGVDSSILYLSFNAVGRSNVAYQSTCGEAVTPNRLAAEDVFHQGTITGNVCWELPAADAEGLLVAYYRDGRRIFMRLRAP